MEYYDAAGAAAQHLSWSSPSQAKQVIPQNRLYPAAAGAGPAYVKLVNRWTGDWLHDAGARVEYGRRADDTALWRIIDADGASWRWIVNKSSGEMIHIEALADWVQCDVKPDGRWSSMWNLAPQSQPWLNIRNRWQVNNAFHIESKPGYLQHKGVNLGWWSAQWFIEVPAASAPTAVVWLSPQPSTWLSQELLAATP